MSAVEKALRDASVRVVNKAEARGRSPLAQAKSRLRRLNIKAAKGLGQHFLIDQTVLDTIVSAADIGPDDTVLEVGPGLGVVTAELVARARKVVAVEIDANLAAGLMREFSHAQCLTVVNANVLDLDPSELIHRQASNEGQAYKVVANLPYYVASPIVRHFLESAYKPKMMVVTVQKEVGQSMAAGPGNMSLVGIGVQMYGKPEIVDYVPARCFYPQPKVDSAIVRIDVYSRPAVEAGDISAFFEVVRAGFSAPRKQLRNALSLGLRLAPSEIEALLSDADIAPSRRPQTLSLHEWAQVHAAVAKMG